MAQADGSGTEPSHAASSLVQPARFAMVAPEPELPSPAGSSQGAKPLTLAEVEASAMAFHPVLREAEGQVRAARGEWLQVGLRPNPAIGYLGEEIGDAGTAGKQGGFVSQEFITAGKLRLGRAVALRDVSAAEQQFERTRLELVTTARIYYFEAVAAQRQVALARQLEAMGSQAVKASELRLQAMEGSRASLLASQVEFESASLLVEQATNRQQAAWRRLASIAGLADATPRPLEDLLAKPLPALDWQQQRERLLAGSPELAELRFRVERAKWAVQQATAGRVPNVNLQTGVQFDHAANDTIANVQVSVPLPLFDRNQGNVSRACGELAAAQAALDERELALAERLAAAIRDYQTASRRVEKFEATILPAAQQSLELISQAYDQGELDYLQLLAAQRTYTEKNVTHLQDLETAWKKWAEIDSLLVGALPGSVD
jgi:outer membrane protein, heavy metal efflux system